jgi:hypothetical protein
MKVGFLASPQNFRFARAGDVIAADNIVGGVPAGTIAVIATISTFDDGRGDCTYHSFGRFPGHSGYAWDNNIYDSNTYFNDVMITHNGDTATTFYYGHSHGSHVIPLKSNMGFDARLNIGYSYGTHYVTVQVYGYITGFGMLTSAQVHNIRIASATQNHASTGFKPTIPSGFAASGIFVSAYTWITPGVSDHYMVSFGRNNAHSTNTFNNLMYDTPGYYNDMILTHSGDNGQRDYYGFAYGSKLIPLKPSTDSFDILNNMYKNDGANTAYVNLQVYGFVPSAAYTNIKFLPATSIGSIKLITTNGNEQVSDIIPPNVPTNSIAIIANVYTFQSNLNDHLVHSFGRYNGHPGSPWDNNVFDYNTYLNDVLITHEGDNAAMYYYGYSHGSQYIPLKSNGKFDAFLGMGKNGAGSGAHYVLLQVFAYITRTCHRYQPR